MGHVPQVRGETMSDEQAIRDLFTAGSRRFRRRTWKGVVANHDPNIVMFDVPPPYNGIRGIAEYRDAGRRSSSCIAKAREFSFSSSTSWPDADVAFAYALLRCGTQAEFDANPDNRLRVTDRAAQGRWSLGRCARTPFVPDGGHGFVIRGFARLRRLRCAPREGCAASTEYRRCSPPHLSAARVVRDAGRRCGGPGLERQVLAAAIRRREDRHQPGRPPTRAGLQRRLHLCHRLLQRHLRRHRHRRTQPPTRLFRCRRGTPGTASTWVHIYEWQWDCYMGEGVPKAWNPARSVAYYTPQPDGSVARQSGAPTSTAARATAR